MPGGNGTGPNGMGPMTGRDAGFCAGYSTAGYANFVGGRGGMGFGRGRGMGMGRGFGRGFGYGAAAWGAQAAYPVNAPAAPAVTAQQELAGLKQQAEFLKDSLSQISSRIDQLEKEQK